MADEAATAALEQVTRPLLELLELTTGLETTFTTHIDWDAQTQEVVHARNSGDLLVAEGSVVAWQDSMCRLTFLAGKEHSSAVDVDFPDSLGAVALGMKTFIAVPIAAGDQTIGTVCGASRRRVELDERVLDSLRLVAQALAWQLSLARESQHHRALALTDELTGLANRRGFAARWEQELASAGRHGHPLSLLVIDVDRFKAVNDERGHAGGDDVLRGLADVLRTVARTDDVAARLGGDEFVLILPHVDLDGATALGHRLRSAFAEAWPGCTVSVGVSSSTTTPLGSLLIAADAAVYEAKRLGRDQLAAR